MTRLRDLELPGDEVVSKPSWQSTRAITIRATPEEIWPWLVQMGFPTHRAGWYTPAWLDRLMWHIQPRSSDRIVPELQHLAVGDVVPDSPDLSVYFTVERVEPGRALVLHSSRHLLPAYRDLDFSWAFVLEAGPGGTRLVIRARAAFDPVWPAPIAWLFVRIVLGAGDLINVSWMLRAIRRRVEDQVATRSGSRSSGCEAR
jgi:hypothetical protein